MFIIATVLLGVGIWAYFKYDKYKRRNESENAPEDALFDADLPELGNTNNNTSSPELLKYVNYETHQNDPTFEQAKVYLTYFSINEFDSPDVSGSGKNMHNSTLLMLDKSRKIAGVPFKINSGYRTKAHNAKLNGAVKNSAHTRGYAADIHVTTKTAKVIEQALRKVGFKRIGKYNTFIHADNDPSKPTPATWYG